MLIFYLEVKNIMMEFKFWRRIGRAGGLKVEGSFCGLLEELEF
jgi:hypothetical protein